MVKENGASASSTSCDTYGAGVTAALCWRSRLSGSRCRGVASALTAATTRDATSNERRGRPAEQRVNTPTTSTRRLAT